MEVTGKESLLRFRRLAFYIADISYLCRKQFMSKRGPDND